jgi:GNAT superfamily N-acetyltransferase
VIQLTEEPYDGPIASTLVAALHQEINERYAAEMADWTPAQLDADVAAYRAEVGPEHVTPPHGVFVVAWLDGEAAGCGALKPVAGVAGSGEIKRMYTAPGARRRGVSRAVLAHLETRAADLGYRGLQLETGTEQPEALALYESHGWERIPPYGRYKDEPSSVCFGKELPG